MGNVELYHKITTGHRTKLSNRELDTSLSYHY